MNMDTPRNLIVRQLFPTPDPPAPAKMRCVSVYIPDSMDHLAAFAGAIALLGKWNSWQKDEAHTARLAAVAWQQCLMLGIRDCETNEVFDGVLLEDFMTMGFRIDPDNNCIMQVWCINHWETFWDISSCVASNASQPSPDTALEAGECRTYHVTLQANSKWLLPLSIQAGTTIQVSNASGGWSDGTAGWNCPNGMTYALGACVSADAPDPGDPLQTVNHMRLIAEYNGQFYDAYNTTIPIFGGTPGNVFFQANDGALEDNQGSVSFDLTVCNTEQTGEWVFRAFGGYDHFDKFTLYAYSGLSAAYNPGTDSVDGIPSGGSTGIGVELPVSAATSITEVIAIINYTSTNGSLQRPGALKFDDVETGDYVYANAVGSSQGTLHWTGTATINSHIKVDGALIGTAESLIYVEVRGTGFNPFV